MHLSSPHEVLGVTPSASAEEIKKAYWKAAMLTHPDRVQGDAAKRKAHEKFVRVQAAYHALTKNGDKTWQAHSRQSSTSKPGNGRSYYQSEECADQNASTTFQEALDNLCMSNRKRRQQLCEIISNAIDQNPALATIAFSFISSELYFHRNEPAVISLSAKFMEKAPDAVALKLFKQMIGILSNKDSIEEHARMCTAIALVLDNKPSWAATVVGDLDSASYFNPGEEAIVTLQAKIKDILSGTSTRNTSKAQDSLFQKLSF